MDDPMSSDGSPDDGRSISNQKAKKKRRGGRLKACSNCGLSMAKSKVSSGQRWTATIRACNKNDWTAEEHSSYLSDLEKDKPANQDPVPSSFCIEKNEEGKYECPVAGCSTQLFFRTKLYSHMNKTHGIDFTEYKGVSGTEFVKRGSANVNKGAEDEDDDEEEEDDEMEQEQQQDSGTIDVFPVHFYQKMTQQRQHLASKSRPGLPESLVNRSSEDWWSDNHTPFPSEKHGLNMYQDNLIRWDDTIRTRFGLLPLEPPMDSKVFANSPSQMFRIMVKDGKLSRKWNEVLNTDEDDVLGVSRQYRVLYAAAQKERKKQKRSGTSSEDKNNPSIEAYKAYAIRRPPRTVFKHTFGDVSDDAVYSSGDSAFSMSKCQETIRNAPTTPLLPIPETPPKPPSSQELEESFWIKEASRLLHAGKRNIQGDLSNTSPETNERNAALNTLQDAIQLENALATLKRIDANTHGPSLDDFIKTKYN